MVYPSSALRIAGCVLLLAGLSGCTYLIPDDASTPRYNTVIGERHKPERNGMVPAAPEMPGAQNMTPVPAMGAPVTQPVRVSEMPLPPVDPQVQAIAGQQMAANQTTNSPALVISSPNIRQVPVENVQATEGGGLLNVPPHPVNNATTGPTVRLNDARRDLEQSRSQAIDANRALTRDAAGEPSMLQQPASPVAVAPLPAPVVPPVAYVQPPAPAPLTPPPPLPARAAQTAPVPVYAAAPAAKSFNPMTPVPASAPAMTPIQLTPPSSAMARSVPAPARAEMPATGSSLPPTSSSFNPLAGSTVATSTYGGSDASAGYLPPSRYTYRR